MIRLISVVEVDQTNDVESIKVLDEVLEVQ